MSLISSTIPNFVNGVSQQPYTLRLSSQGAGQLNGLSTVSSGLRKRPPSEHIAKIADFAVSNRFVHLLDRDGTEQYYMLLSDSNIEIYDLQGVKKPVNPTDIGYLTTSINASDTFAVTTVADYSFIVNKTKLTKASTAISPIRPAEALFNVKLGNYGKTYTISVNGNQVASYATPDGSAATQSVDLSTDAIASRLQLALVANGYNTAPWVCSVSGAVIYLKNTSTDFTVSATDGFNSNALVAIKGKLQKFTDLPSNPQIDSFTVQITGDQSSAFDNYWVKFDAGGINGTAGTWRETLAPGTPLGVDPLSMPHVLIREANGTFTFKPADWTPRMVGDITSNANPSFLGSAINDVFFFQNRLGFLSDENFVQSETGKYFNMFRTTVVSLLDSDPVDVNAATNKVAVLRHAVSFNKQLLLFSNQQQFVVESSDLMSPKRVPIKPTTDFYVSTRARPVASGRNVYFTTDKGLWSSVREYFVDLNNLTNDASDVTAHVPMYVPSGITKISAGTSEDVLVLLSENDRSSMYVYKYYFSGNEKLQSSWSKFSFDSTTTILSCDFIRSVLYMVVARPGGVYLEKIDFSIGASIAGEPYRVHLDHKVQIPTSALTFDGVNTLINTLSIGYPTEDGRTYSVVAKGGGLIKAGQVFTVNSGGSINSIPGNVTESALTFGEQYMFRYTLSPLTVKFSSYGVSKTADTEGRTQVRRISFNHSDTGYYRVNVTPDARQTYSYVFSGKVMGTQSALIGTEALSTGRLNVPVMTRNNTVSIVIESELPLPVSIFSADWEAFYVKRSRPV